MKEKLLINQSMPTKRGIFLKEMESFIKEKKNLIEE